MLAVLEAVAAALPAKGRARLIHRLEVISTDWERQGAPSDLRTTSQRFLRPALNMLAPPAA